MSVCITADYVRQIFAYDENSGNLIWKNRPIEHFATQRACGTWNKRFAGKRAGHITAAGYILIEISGKPFLAHRLVWLYVNGNWPNNQIDHINGIRQDNRIFNLRDVLHKTNGKNTKMPSHNTSGHIGVSFHKKAKKWRAYIKVNQKNLHLGIFNSKADAIKARIEAQDRFEFHANHGRIGRYARRFSSRCSRTFN